MIKILIVRTNTKNIFSHSIIHINLANVRANSQYVMCAFIYIYTHRYTYINAFFFNMICIIKEKYRVYLLANTAMALFLSVQEFKILQNGILKYSRFCSNYLVFVLKILKKLWNLPKISLYIAMALFLSIQE